MLQCVLLFIYFLVTIVKTIPIDNEIIGDLNITCLESSVIVNFKTKNPFNGRVYIRGSFDVPACNADFSNNFQENAVMTLPFNDCNSHRERLLSPNPGIMHVATVIISFHPLFITKVDKAYRIECVYKLIDVTVTNLLDVSMIPTVQYNYAPPIPVCRYDLRVGNVTGAEVRYVNVGDSVYHHWICDSDKHIMPNITYSLTMAEAWVETHAFTYQDVASLHFNCKLSLCLKSDSVCFDDWSSVCSNFDFVTSLAPAVKNGKHQVKRATPYFEQHVFSDDIIVSDAEMWANQNSDSFDYKNGKRATFRAIFPELITVFVLLIVI